MARLETTLRVFRIIHFLETDRAGLKVSEIHKKLQHEGYTVDIRTVHRDLQLLSQAHVPLHNEGEGPESRWRISGVAEVRNSIKFTYEEIFTLFVARKSLDHLKGTPFHGALERMFEKLEKVLGHDAKMFEELLGNVAFRPQMTWHTSVPPVVIDTVYSALEEGHPLRISYRAEAGENAGRVVDRLVGPECLYFANGSVYLIAIDLKKNEPRTYALSRVAEAEMLNTEVYKKTGIAPENLFKWSIGILNTGDVANVEIMVQGPLGTYMSERRWHESQETIRTDKGTLLKLKVKINDELLRFIVGLGPHAEVLQPVGLRDDVSSYVQRIASVYSRKVA